MNELFSDYYYSEANILSNNELWKQIKKDPRFNREFTRLQYDKWLGQQAQEQIKTIKYKPPQDLFHPIVAKPQSYQCDLMFLKDLYSKNDRYDAIINFIEMNTRKAYSYPLKTKTSSDVFSAFERFYKDIEGKIKFFSCDKGKEFSSVILFCNKNNISTVIYKDDKNSMSMVERFNRTLRSYLDKKMKKGRWIDILDKIVNAYNNKIHSSTDLTPVYLESHPKNQHEIRNKIIMESIDARMQTNKFKIGDKVRIYLKRNLFGKGLGSFSKTIHTITNIHKNSIFVDDKPQKYRYYNLTKVDHIPNDPASHLDEDLNKARKLYKTAYKLAKEQLIRIPVKDLEVKLKENVEDETTGRGKRIKKPNLRFV